MADEEDPMSKLRGPEQGFSGQFKDDITGQVLNDELVKQARMVELEYFRAKSVWTKRPKAECYRQTGRPPISVRWVDVNKGDDVNPRYRSRLVARQLKCRDTSGTSYFAPAPPLEGVKAILSCASTTFGKTAPDLDPTSEHRTTIGLYDISRAYFCAEKDVDDFTYVDLPREDPEHGVMCALLLRHMYGTRAAADGWQEEYSTSLIAMGFVQGTSCTTIFHHPSRSLKCTVHGDDFTCLGPRSSMTWFEEQLGAKYEYTCGGRLGPGPTDDKEGMILNRVVRWSDNGIEWEADPRQSEKLVSECGLDGSKSVATPGVRIPASEALADRPLDKKLHTPFRGAAARANYLAQDRMDVQFAAKEVCRAMATPTDQAWTSMKRLCRYLVGAPRLVYLFPWQRADAIDIYVDTDWAGCPRSRRSTSGGLTMVGRHAVKTWSSTQASVSLSSGEAEFAGVVRGAGMGLGFQSLMQDLGHQLPVRVWCDSSAAIGICSRQGLGKLRHLDTHTLWVQQAVRSGKVDLRKIRGEQNPADLLTKHLTSSERLKALVKVAGGVYRSGRSDSAPQMRSTKLGKATMAEAHAVEAQADDDVYEPPVMPHVDYPDRMDSVHPSLEVPPDCDGDSEQLMDRCDPVFQRGLALARDIAEQTMTHGRRRLERGVTKPST